MQNVQKLQSLQTKISVPFVTCSFGGETFGLTERYYGRSTMAREIRYITSLTVDKKASGQVNTYSMVLNYLVEPGADPNWIEYVISRATDRNITFGYGDLSAPSSYYSFKDGRSTPFAREQAMMSTVVPNLNMSNHSIQYTFSATSSVALNYSIKRTFPAHTSTKPSDIIRQVLRDSSNGLLDLFTGMQDETWVSEQGLIPGNDKAVYIAAQSDIAPLDYIRLLVSKMQAPDNSFFAMIIHDEPENINGPYFEVVNSVLHQGKGTTYSVDIDVGYPSDTQVYSFTPKVNTALSLITPYQDKLDVNRVININSFGDKVIDSTPSWAIKNGKAQAGLQQWWKSMVNYPVSATLKTRGLIKPSILCDYLQINVLFFGQPYIYGGFYMVTAQKDVVDSGGFSSELSIIRVEG